MYIRQLDKTLKSLALAHRDNKVARRFSTMVTGGSGIGKTDVVKKIATELDMAVVIIHVAQLEPGELLGIPRSMEVRKGVTVQRYDLPGYLPHYLCDSNGQPISKTFEDGIVRNLIDVELLGSKVKNRAQLKAKHGNQWHQQVKGVILFLDEISRAVGDDTKQAIFELPGDYSLHEYEVPESVVIFAAANPSTNDYQVNDMDQEKAWMDRFIHLKAEGRIEDSINYFEKNGFEDTIISFISADNEALMVPEEPYKLNVTRTPRSYEVLDNVLKYVDLPNEDSIKQEVFSGILGLEYGTTFANHLKNTFEFVPNGLKICTAYDEVRSFILDAVEKNKSSFINQTTTYLHSFLSFEENVTKHFYRQADQQDVDFARNEGLSPVSLGESIPNTAYINNLTQYLMDLPSDFRMSLIIRIVKFDWVNDLISEEKEIFDILKLDGDIALEKD